MPSQWAPDASPSANESIPIQTTLKINVYGLELRRLSLPVCGLFPPKSVTSLRPLFWTAQKFHEQVWPLSDVLTSVFGLPFLREAFLPVNGEGKNSMHMVIHVQECNSRVSMKHSGALLRKQVWWGSCLYHRASRVAQVLASQARIPKESTAFGGESRRTGESTLPTLCQRPTCGHEARSGGTETGNTWTNATTRCNARQNGERGSLTALIHAD